MKKKGRRPWLLLAVLLLTVWSLGACDNRTVYNHYEHAPSAGWDKNDSLLFDIPAVKVAGAYREELGLRIDHSFPFQGLCLVVKHTILPSGYVHSDTINCSLFDEDGNTKGYGVSYYQYRFHTNTLRLQTGDSLHICVRHNMMREILPGVSDVGVRFSYEPDAVQRQYEGK